MGSGRESRHEPFHYRFLGISLLVHALPLAALISYSVDWVERSESIESTKNKAAAHLEPVAEERESVAEQELDDELAELTKKALESFPRDILLSPEVFNQLPAVIHQEKDGTLGLDELFGVANQAPVHHRVALVEYSSRTSPAPQALVKNNMLKNELFHLKRLASNLGTLEQEFDDFRREHSLEEDKSPTRMRKTVLEEVVRDENSAKADGSTLPSEKEAAGKSMNQSNVGVEVAVFEALVEKPLWESEQKAEINSPRVRSDAPDQWEIWIRGDESKKGKAAQASGVVGDGHAQALEKMLVTGKFESGEGHDEGVYSKSIDTVQERRQGLVVNRIYELSKALYGSDYSQEGFWEQTHLRFLLDDHGYVERVQIMRSSGSREADRKAIDVLHLAEPYIYVDGWIEMHLPM